MNNTKARANSKTIPPKKKEDSGYNPTIIKQQPSSSSSFRNNPVKTTTTTTTTTHQNSPLTTTNTNKLNNLIIPKFKSPPNTPTSAAVTKASTPSSLNSPSISNHTKSLVNKNPLPPHINNTDNTSTHPPSSMGSGKPSKIPKPPTSSKTFIGTPPSLISQHSSNSILNNNNNNTSSGRKGFEPTNKQKRSDSDSIFRGSKIPRPKAQTFVYTPTTTISNTPNTNHHHQYSTPTNETTITFTNNNQQISSENTSIDSDFASMDDNMNIFDHDEELITFKLHQPLETVHNDRYEILTNQQSSLLIETPSPVLQKKVTSDEIDDSSTSPIKKTSPTSTALYSQKKNETSYRQTTLNYSFNNSLFIDSSIEDQPFNIKMSENLISSSTTTTSNRPHVAEEELKINHHQQSSSPHDTLPSLSTTTTIDDVHQIKRNNCLITDLPIYMEIFKLAKEGKELELFKTLIDLECLSKLVDKELKEEPPLEIYDQAFNKFMSKGVFAKLIVKPEILTLNSIDPESGGNTALHNAINEHQIGTASLLCKCKRIINQNNDRHYIDIEFLNIDQYNFKQETPLHIATIKNYPNIAHLLLQNGSKAYQLNDSFGHTALELAAIYEREAIAHSICEHGGDTCEMYNDKIERISPPANDENHGEKIFDRFGFPVSNPQQNKWTFTTKRNVKITEHVSIDVVKQPLLYNELLKRRIKEESRVVKWKSMLKDVREHHEKGDFLYLPKKFKERVRKGIPNEVRGEAWIYLTQSHILKKKNENVYNELKSKPLSMKDSKQIDVDIKREFREHCLFAHRYGKYQIQLFNILRAYCNYNTKLGYTQGMSSIAAMLLMYLNEEDSFWVFCSIMEGEEYNMQEMYFPGLPGVSKATFVLSSVLSKKMKKFMKTFENNEYCIGLNAFCTRWYMLNMLTQVHFDIAVLFWDLYLSEGHKVIHSVSLAFMRIFKKFLNKSKPDEATLFMSKLMDVDFDLEKLMRKILKSKIKAKTLRKIEIEYEKKHN